MNSKIETRRAGLAAAADQSKQTDHAEQACNRRLRDRRSGSNHIKLAIDAGTAVDVVAGCRLGHEPDRIDIREALDVDRKPGFGTAGTFNLAATSSGVRLERHGCHAITGVGVRDQLDIR